MDARERYATYVGGRLAAAAAWQRAGMAGIYESAERTRTVWEWTATEPADDPIAAYDAADGVTKLTCKPEQGVRRVGFRLLLQYNQ